MTYLADEQSVANSKPIELYRFDGTYVSYYYTSGPRDVAYQAPGDVAPITYKAISIERSEVKTGTHEDDGLDITVKMGVAQQVVQDYGLSVSPPNLKLTVYRVQPNGFVVYWTGPVNSINIDDAARASLRCPSALGNALVGNVPNVYYQRQCNNVLGDARCKIDLTAWTQAGAITAIGATDPKAITVSTIGTLDGKLIGGELRLASGERRKIISQVGTTVHVNYAFSKIVVGNGCFVTAGCDHVWAGDCKTRFNNRKNYGGFMFIPPENPFASGIDPKAEGVADTPCIFEPFPGWWLKVRVYLAPTGTQAAAGWPSHWFYYDANNDLSFSENAGILYSAPATAPVSIEYVESGGRPLYMEYTFWQAQYPVDFTRLTTRHYWLRMQFAAFSVTPSPSPAVVQYQKWDMTAFVDAVATNYPQDSYSPPQIGYQGLFPRDYYFVF